MAAKGERLTEKEQWEIIEKNAWLPLAAMRRIITRHHWPILVEGEGIYLRDVQGKTYIDGTSGFLCASLGHGNRRIIEAIKEQLEEVQYPPGGHAEPGLKLMQKIAQLAPGDLNRVYLGVTGSDANEMAISVARQYFHTSGKPNHIILSRFYAYHGMSAGAISIVGLAGMRLGRERDFGGSVHFVSPPYCYRCDFGLTYPQCKVLCARIVDETINKLGPNQVAAFIGEPVMGAGGIIDPPDEYWPIIRDICKKHNILFILDEVITGFGKTGKLFAAEHWGVVPDMLSFAKAVSSSYLPQSGVVTRDHVWEAFFGEGREERVPYGGHTMSASPLSAAASLASIDEILERKLWENSAKVGAHLKAELQKVAKESKIVGDVRGRGLMLGVEIVEDKESKKPTSRLAGKLEGACEENGLLLQRAMGPSFNVFMVAPPMILTKEEADKIVDRFSAGVKKVEATAK